MDFNRTMQQGLELVAAIRLRKSNEIRAPFVYSPEQGKLQAALSADLRSESPIREGMWKKLVTPDGKLQLLP